MRAHGAGGWENKERELQRAWRRESELWRGSKSPGSLATLYMLVAPRPMGSELWPPGKDATGQPSFNRPRAIPHMLCPIGNGFFQPCMCICVTGPYFFAATKIVHPLCFPGSYPPSFLPKKSPLELPTFFATTKIVYPRAQHQCFSFLNFSYNKGVEAHIFLFSSTACCILALILHPNTRAMLCE